MRITTLVTLLAAPLALAACDSGDNTEAMDEMPMADGQMADDQMSMDDGDMAMMGSDGAMQTASAEGTVTAIDADAGTITAAELADHPVMLPPVGTIFRDAIDQELQTIGVRLTAAAEVDGLRLLASLAYQGYAPALLPASAVSGYPEGNWSLVHVDGLARRSVGLVRNRRTTPSMPVLATRDALRDVIRKIAPRQPGIHVTLQP